MALLEEIKVPLLAVNDTTLTVAELAFATGAGIKKGEVILVFETSKTTYDVEAGAEGFVQYLCLAGQDYEVNTLVARVYSEAAEAVVVQLPVTPMRSGSMAAASAPTSREMGPASTAMPASSGAPAATGGPNLWRQETSTPWQGETIFSLEAAQLIEAHGLDRALFQGRDLVGVADVRRVLEPVAEPARMPQTQRPVGAPKQPLPVDPNKAVLEKLTSAKKREIEYLGEVQSTGLTSTLHTYVDTEGIFTHINRSLQYLKDSLLPVIIYEAARSLVDFPQLNSYFTGDGIASYRTVDPGFAIDIDKGLKVVKVAGAGEKSLQEIETAILSLSGDYLDDKLRLEDLTDITFTITDLSAEAVAFFKPLVNKQNSAILGVSAIDPKLQRCALSLTFDHRVTEGRTAARFLKDLKERVESYRPQPGVAREDISCFKCFKTLAEDLGGAGFIRCITPEGKEGYICQPCIKGF